MKVETLTGPVTRSGVLDVKPLHGMVHVKLAGGGYEFILDLEPEDAVRLARQLIVTAQAVKSTESGEVRP